MSKQYMGKTALAALIEKVKSAIADAATKIKAEHVTFDDGETFQYKLEQGTLKGDKGEKGDAGKDGAPGAAGKDGAPGAAAGFGAVTATVDNGVGEPSVEVEPGGTDAAKTFQFSFHNLKGDPGTPAENMEELSAAEVETAWTAAE